LQCQNRPSDDDAASPKHVEGGMSDEQFRIVLLHLQVMIALLGVMAGTLLALAWEYL
jgi:hypothetical protein